MLTIFPCKSKLSSEKKESVIVYAWVNFPACGKENWSVPLDSHVEKQGDDGQGRRIQGSRQRRQPSPLPKQCGSSRPCPCLQELHLESRALLIWNEIGKCFQASSLKFQSEIPLRNVIYQGFQLVKPNIMLRYNTF